MRCIQWINREAAAAISRAAAGYPLRPCAAGPLPRIEVKANIASAEVAREIDASRIHYGIGNVAWSSARC